MSLKPYSELVKIDVSKHCKERDKIKYLPWASCKQLLHDNGAETVYFIPITNKDGSSLFMSDAVFKDKSEVTNRCYEVRIKVVIDDKEYEYQTPVMNGANPVRDNSMSQQRVWNAQTRAFVKAVAMFTGLGFSLWLDDEDPQDDMSDDLYKHNIMLVKERVERLITVKLDGGLSKSDICKGLKVREDQFDIYMKQYAILDYLEKEIQKL
jgi:hypothetical protein